VEADMRDQQTTWIVLGTDGRHVSIGRHRKPDEDDLARASAALVAAGQDGWLAVLYGDYYGTRAVRIDVLRPLTPGTPTDSSLAVAAFLNRRMQALSQILD
jgi:hypothetical protein